MSAETMPHTTAYIPLKALMLFLFVLGIATSGRANAQYQDTVLTVAINTPTKTTSVDYSMLDLDAFEQTEIRTANDFVDGEKTFAGPKLSDLLAPLTDGSTVTLTAVNEYEVIVPFSEFLDYPVILATRMSGKLLSPRDKGPIWVIYPMSDYADLKDNIYNSRLVWQLRKIEVN